MLGLNASELGHRICSQVNFADRYMPKISQNLGWHMQLKFT